MAIADVHRCMQLQSVFIAANFESQYYMILLLGHYHVNRGRLRQRDYGNLQSLRHWQ